METQFGKRALTITLLLLLVGCGKSSRDPDTSDGKTTASKRDNDAPSDDKKLTPAERKYLAAGKPFALAIATGKYNEAFAQFSSYATAQMSLNQFAPEDDNAKFAENEKNAIPNVTAEKFTELMKRTEERLGAPRSLQQFYVFSTDPTALDRRGKEKLDAINAMFAIGNLPEWVPVEMRRASLRGRVRVQLPAEAMEKLAKDEGTTVAELEKSPDFEPYFTIKIVLIEETGQLKVGYFEFLPPGIMD